MSAKEFHQASTQHSYTVCVLNDDDDEDEEKKTFDVAPPKYSKKLYNATTHEVLTKEDLSDGCRIERRAHESDIDA